MVYKFFCDTNVVIDFLLKERANHNVAFRLFEAVQNDAVIGFISETTITNIAYVFRKPEPAELLKQHLKTLLFYFNVLPNNTEVCQSAFNDIEDVILYHLALHHSLDYFVSENGYDFKTGALPQLPVCSTSSFVQLL